ncbi:hypothetical protein D3C85_1835900 [compost metagenome]
MEAPSQPDIKRLIFTAYIVAVINAEIVPIITPKLIPFLFTISFIIGSCFN